MDSFITIVHENNNSATDTWFYLSQTSWTGIYTVVNTLATAFIAVSAFYAYRGIQSAKALHAETNSIQQDRILQDRLIELSHEWNSKDFIDARNRAAHLRKEFLGRETQMYAKLINNGRTDEWVHISMIAHFFERLSLIQMSRQIYRKNAILEFKEALDYWFAFLVLAYNYDGDGESEKRMCRTLESLWDEYAREHSEIP